MAGPREWAERIVPAEPRGPGDLIPPHSPAGQTARTLPAQDHGSRTNGSYDLPGWCLPANQVPGGRPAPPSVLAGVVRPPGVTPPIALVIRHADEADGKFPLIVVFGPGDAAWRPDVHLDAGGSVLRLTYDDILLPRQVGRILHRQVAASGATTGELLEFIEENRLGIPPAMLSNPRREPTFNWLPPARPAPPASAGDRDSS